MIPFLFFETDFDPTVFKKYYGPIEKGGVYAIPEEDSEPDSPQDFLNKNDEDQTDLEQTTQNQEQLVQQIQQMQPLQQPQLSDEERQAIEAEMEPLKRLYLLNKLYELSHILKNKFYMDTDLDIVLKFGSMLKYKTLEVLAINILNQLQQMTNEKLAAEQQNGDQTQNGVQNAV